MTEQKSSKGLIIGLVVAGVLLVIGLVAAGIAYAIWGVATERKSTIPERLGADVQLYGTFTPALSDLANGARLHGAFPELFIEENPETVNEPLEEWGLSFETDIQPWLGAEVAFALGNLPPINKDFNDIDEQALADLDLALLAYSKDDTAAAAFLEKLRTVMLAEEDDLADITTTIYNDVTIYEMRYADSVSPKPPLNAFAVTKGIVVMASTEYIRRMIDREPGGEDALSRNANFAKFYANLPANAFSYLYLDAQPLIQLNEAFLAEAATEMTTEQEDMLKESLEMIRAMESLGNAAGVAAEGVFIETMYAMNMDSLSEKNRAVFTYQPGDLKARLDRISNTALALMTFSVQPSFKDQIVQAINVQPDGKDQLTTWEEMYDIDLEEDLLNWFHGDASLVILPGEDLGDLETPATFYFSLTPPDREAAERGVKNITNAIETIGLPIPNKEIAGVEWSVIQLPGEKQLYGGYGFVADDFVLAFGEKTLETVVKGSDAPISADASFQSLLNNLPVPERGMVNMDTKKIADLAEETGTDIDADVKEKLTTLQAVGLSGNPTQDEGVLRARLFLYITE